MKRGFKIMREDQRHKQFVYSCSEGHEWMIPFSEYNSERYDERGEYKPLTCPECEALPGC